MHGAAKSQGLGALSGRGRGKQQMRESALGIFLNLKKAKARKGAVLSSVLA